MLNGLHIATPENDLHNLLTSSVILSDLYLIKAFSSVGLNYHLLSLLHSLTALFINQFLPDSFLHMNFSCSNSLLRIVMRY